MNTFYIERAINPHGLAWDFVQDYDDADTAAIHLDAIRARNPERTYRLIEVLDA
jgi:hypothetical protein